MGSLTAGLAPNPIRNQAQLTHPAWLRSLTAIATTHVQYIAEALIPPLPEGN